MSQMEPTDQLDAPNRRFPESRVGRFAKAAGNHTVRCPSCRPDPWRCQGPETCCASATDACCGRFWLRLRAARSAGRHEVRACRHAAVLYGSRSARGTAGRRRVASSTAFGMLLYDLMTGTYPMRGRWLKEVREAHANGTSVPLHEARPDLPEDLVRIHRSRARP